MSGTHAPGGAARPPGLVVLAAVVGLEALAVAAIGVLALVASPFGDGVTSGIAVAVFVLLIAVLLGAVAAGLARGRAWTRAATLVWQLVQALVGAFSLQGSGPNAVFAVVAIGLAVVALVLLFTGPVRAATERS